MAMTSWRMRVCVWAYVGADMLQHQLGVLARLNALMVGAICKCN